MNNEQAGCWREKNAMQWVYQKNAMQWVYQKNAMQWVYQKNAMQWVYQKNAMQWVYQNTDKLYPKNSEYFVYFLCYRKRQIRPKLNNK
jgi:hypothetical protein